jgi:transposase
MDVIYECCCGLDVHKKTVAACLIISSQEVEPRKEIHTFGTMTDDLLRLSDWLLIHGVTHVAMESTGIYWKPVWNLLEGSFQLLLVNAHHVKAVPGRKTDIKDCDWIADLLRHGLLRGSFVPDRPERELRELTRYRNSLVRERSAEVNRLHKTLEGANIKLATVASDITGKSGREMLELLVGGATDTAAMASVARGRMREKIPELQRALRGSFGDHQCFLVARQLAHIDFLDEAIAALDAELNWRLRPFEEELQRLDAIPGVGRRTAEVLLAELGMNMERFPSDRHLASWAGMCPGNNESGGKRRSGKTRKGSPWLRSALIEAAQAASRTRGTYLSARYHRLAARRGKKRACVAVGHSILIAAYHLLKHGCTYQDFGALYFDERNRQRVVRRQVHRLEALGYEVTLQPA